MKIIITGPTGTAGADAVLAALADPRVEKITALSRQPLAITQEKLKVILHKDFLDYSRILSDLRGYNACLWCLGISQNQVSPEDYQKITFDYTLAGAKAMASVNPGFTFCFLSGDGADSSEKSRIRFARVKGMAENALGRLGLPHLYHFRPAYIHSTSQPADKRKLADRILSPLAPLLHKLIPGMIVDAKDLGRAMIQVALKGSEKTILSNRDIRKIAESVQA